MNCTRTTTIIGYQVKYYDLREPKPRAAHDEVYALEKDTVKSLGLLGLNVADFITGRYARGGYHVAAIERIPAARVVDIDLGKLWAGAGEPTGKEGPGHE